MTNQEIADIMVKHVLNSAHDTHYQFNIDDIMKITNLSESHIRQNIDEIATLMVKHESVILIGYDEPDDTLDIDLYEIYIKHRKR